MTENNEQKSIVLYADDDADDIELVREGFEKYATDVELLTFGNGSELLSHLNNSDPQQRPPCLIILDINMPVMDGKQTLIRIKNSDTYSNVPIVLFTTSNQPQERQFAEKLAAGSITKPLNLHQLQEIIYLFIDHCTEEIRKKIRKQIQ